MLAGFTGLHSRHVIGVPGEWCARAAGRASRARLPWSPTARQAITRRSDDLSPLPPAFIQVNELDPLGDEGLAYAVRLLAAGVPIELHFAPGLGHGAVAVDSPLSRHTQLIFDAALKRALAE